MYVCCSMCTIYTACLILCGFITQTILLRSTTHATHLYNFYSFLLLSVSLMECGKKLVRMKCDRRSAV